MFEQTFKNIDDILHKDAGCSSELDYVEQTSWILFLKYLDDLEKDKKTAAKLSGKAHTGIISPEYRWEVWAVPKDKDSKLDHHKALTGDDLKEFVDHKLFPYLQINSLTVKKGLCPKFFYYALSTKGFFEEVIKNSAQATLPIINKGKWEKLTVSYPSLEKEQQTIVAKLDTLSAETKKLEAIYQQKLNDLEELKKSILHKAFNGELVGACS